MNYLDASHVDVYRDMVAGDIRSSRRNGRQLRARAQRILASALVLSGARLMPETPVVVGGRVLVFEPVPGRDPRDHGLRPAA